MLCPLRPISFGFIPHACAVLKMSLPPLYPIQWPHSGPPEQYKPVRTWNLHPLFLLKSEEYVTSAFCQQRPSLPLLPGQVYHGFWSPCLLRDLVPRHAGIALTPPGYMPVLCDSAHRWEAAWVDVVMSVREDDDDNALGKTPWRYAGSWSQLDRGLCCSTAVPWLSPLPLSAPLLALPSRQLQIWRLTERDRHCLCPLFFPQRPLALFLLVAASSMTCWRLSIMKLPTKRCLSPQSRGCTRLFRFL